MTAQNRSLVFAPTRKEPFRFDVAETPLPAPGPGQVLVHNLWFSCDPLQFAWLSTGDDSVRVRPGQPMRTFGAGKVLASRNPAFPVGARVWGTLAWQEFSLSDGSGPLPLRRIGSASATTDPLGITGINGVTAYLGLLDICQVRAGDSVLVSSAAGATGLAAVQLATLRGARVVGIAGGPRKCAFLRDELQVDGAIDYKQGDLSTQLAQHFPRGVDCYFDNVGGPTLDAVLGHMGVRGRLALCGATSTYATGPAPWRNSGAVLAKLLRLEGFSVMDRFDRFESIANELELLVREGKLRGTQDTIHGLERAPEALLGLLQGDNLGKRLVRVSPEASL